jgi:hypothetical protein
MPGKGGFENRFGAEFEQFTNPCGLEKRGLNDFTIVATPNPSPKMVTTRVRDLVAPRAASSIFGGRKEGEQNGVPHRSVETKRGCKIDFLTILRTPKKGLQKGFPYHSVEAEKEGGPGEVQYELQGVNAQGERLRSEPCQKGDSLMAYDEGFIST